MQTRHNTLFDLPSARLRDLYWSLAGPSLLDQNMSASKSDWLPDLLQLAIGINPPLLQDNIGHSMERHRRIGRYFEQLWQTALTQAGWRWQANMTIQGSNRTLGELDLLMEDQQGQQHHLELALKFYLGTQEGWLGPGARDSLDRKLDHLFGHQLALAKDPAAQASLQAAGWQPQTSEAIIRGCLFYPAHKVPFKPLPTTINPQHWRGFWAPWTASQALLGDGLWYVLDKHYWCSPAVVEQAVDSQELQRWLHVWFRHINQPVCIIRVQSGPAGFEEQQRWMLVPDGWPAMHLHPPRRSS
jgi:uncharacterized protein